MVFLLSISWGISHWRGSGQCWSDSGTNTALSSHAQICSPRAHAAAYLKLHESGSQWQLVFLWLFFFFFISFWGFLSSTNLCFPSLYFVISVQRKKLLCDCGSLPVERRKTPIPPWAQRASVIPFRVSVTLQLLLAFDAQRPNCPRRPSTLRK